MRLTHKTFFFFFFFFFALGLAAFESSLVAAFVPPSSSLVPCSADPTTTASQLPRLLSLQPPAAVVVPKVSPTRLSVSTPDIATDASSFLIATEEWRQYVPLIVSALVIVDILLGSPAANMVLRMGQAADSEQDDENKGLLKNKDNAQENRERIDSSAVAQAAIEKARYSLELRNFLEEQKTDYDRMEDMKKQMDQTIADIEEQQERNKRAAEK